MRCRATVAIELVRVEGDGREEWRGEAGRALRLEALP
jgi:hypothetical protein